MQNIVRIPQLNLSRWEGKIIGASFGGRSNINYGRRLNGKFEMNLGFPLLLMKLSLTYVSFRLSPGESQGNTTECFN